MKIVNKHHSKLQEEIAHYRKDVNELHKHFERLEANRTSEFRQFMDTNSLLMSKLNEINLFLVSQSVGVQNIYDKFLELNKNYLRK